MADLFQNTPFNRRQRLIGMALVFSVAVALASFIARQTALADAGGNPTKTPTPTVTVTQTLAEYPFPTQIVITEIPPQIIVPTAQPGEPHALPATATPLSSDEILAALTATAQAAAGAPGSSAGFWFYMLLLFGVSAAIVGIIFFSMWYRKRNAPPPEE